MTPVGMAVVIAVSVLVGSYLGLVCHIVVEAMQAVELQDEFSPLGDTEVFRFSDN